jgi:hypothetical protein
MLGTNKNAASQGRRVTRVDAPALEEAIIAAQGLTDDIESQIEIACQLMGMPEDEVRPVVMQSAMQSRRIERAPNFERADGPKVVVVERRRPRVMTR